MGFMVFNENALHTYLYKRCIKEMDRIYVYEYSKRLQGHLKVMKK